MLENVISTAALVPGIAKAYSIIPDMFCRPIF
jgi:hypothetical protein